MLAATAACRGKHHQSVALHLSFLTRHLPPAAVFVCCRLCVSWPLQVTQGAQSSSHSRHSGISGSSRSGSSAAVLPQSVGVSRQQCSATLRACGRPIQGCFKCCNSCNAAELCCFFAVVLQCKGMLLLVVLQLLLRATEQPGCAY
jgi:hypothetical protein